MNLSDINMPKIWYGPKLNAPFNERHLGFENKEIYNGNHLIPLKGKK